MNSRIKVTVTVKAEHEGQEIIMRMEDADIDLLALRETAADQQMELTLPYLLDAKYYEAPKPILGVVLQAIADHNAKMQALKDLLNRIEREKKEEEEGRKLGLVWNGKPVPKTDALQN